MTLRKPPHQPGAKGPSPRALLPMLAAAFGAMARSGPRFDPSHLLYRGKTRHRRGRKAALDRSRRRMAKLSRKKNRGKR